MEYLSICQIISIYGIIFFVFLSVSMAAQPQHFEFPVSDELINCCIISTVLYGIILLITSLMLYWRRKNQQAQGIQGRKLMSEQEEDRKPH